MISSMNYKILVTDGFKKHAKSIAKKHHSLKSDLGKLIASLKENPFRENLSEKIAIKLAWLSPPKGRANLADPG